MHVCDAYCVVAYELISTLRILSVPCFGVFCLIFLAFAFHPTIRIGKILSLKFYVYNYGFLSRGFTDRREILHGGSA